MRGKNKTWSPSRLNSALQCPYLYFAKSILKINPLIDTVSIGATAALFGSLAHRVLEEYFRCKSNGNDFDLRKYTRQQYEKKSIYFSAHLEMDRDLESLVECLEVFTRQFPGSIIEGFKPQEFELRFGRDGAHPGAPIDYGDGLIKIEGQIDRIDRNTDDEVVIIDYKYKKAPGANLFIDELFEGYDPQLPLYGYFLQEVLNKKPIALMQIFLRSQSVIGLKFRAITESEFPSQKNVTMREISLVEKNDLYTTVLMKLVQTATELDRGMIRPNPRDFTYCGPGRCDYADLCRYRQRWMKQQ